MIISSPVQILNYIIYSIHSMVVYGLSVRYIATALKTYRGADKPSIWCTLFERIHAVSVYEQTLEEKCRVRLFPTFRLISGA